MVRVAMVSNPVPEDRARRAKPAARRPVWHARYLASRHGPAGLGGRLQRQAAQVGLGRAERGIALSDGGAGLEDWRRLRFPRVAAVILDFDHASEHLAELAKAWHARQHCGGRGSASGWGGSAQTRGGQAVLEELRALAPPASASRREVWRATVTDFENQGHRMDSPSYRAQGWRIGSGPVEAGCKAVMGQRLKGAGMRWSRLGADGVAHLRALVLSQRGQWAASWTHRQNHAA
jgi:hypothetical protein